jgi:hypothetical protein
MKPASRRRAKPAAAAAVNVEDRRRNPRVELVSELYGLVVALDLPVLVRNASRGGLLIESACPFPVGSEQSFRFQASSGHAATVVAVCRHIRRVGRADSAPRYAAGFEFLPQPSEHLRRALAIIAQATIAESATVGA